MITPGMLLAMVTFAYTGLVLSFWAGVYGTCIGRSDFREAKSLVGLHGIGKEWYNTSQEGAVKSSHSS